MTNDQLNMRINSDFHKAALSESLLSAALGDNAAPLMNTATIHSNKCFAKSWHGFFWQIVVAFLAFAIFYFMLFRSLYAWMFWNETTGTVLTSSITKLVSETAHSYRIRNCSYTYQVESKHYTSARITFVFDEYHTGSWEDAIRFQLGSAIKVYYSPSNPKQAVLYCGICEHVIWFFAKLVLGAGGLFIGIFLLSDSLQFLFCRMRRARHQRNEVVA